MKIALVGAAGVGVALVLLVAAVSVAGSRSTQSEERAAPSAPVETAMIGRRDMADIRTLSGTLHARSRALIATRIAGRIEALPFNIGDTVRNDDVIALLDGAEHQQAVNEAHADLQLAQATLAEAESMLATSQRNYLRVRRLFEGNIASESELDASRADFEAKEARVRVSESQVARAEAQHRAAEVRLSYATIRAVWPDPNGPRIIGERYVDEGSTVAANGPIVSLLDIDTLLVVVHVSERDYARLRVGQACRVTSESHRDEDFEGHVVRLSPEFREASRQARVEVEMDNEGHRLKPGMFVRVHIELAHAEDALVIPLEALVRRRGEEGVFLVDESDMTARFAPVRTGIREGGYVQVLEPFDPGTGRVVTMGQHLLDDGSGVRFVREDP